MVKKPTIILLAVFAVLAAFAWWFQGSPYSAANSGTATPTSIVSPLANWKTAETRLIKYTGNDGSHVSIRMGKTMSDWSIDEDSSLMADSGKVMQIISELQAIKPLAHIDSSIDQKAIGLDDASRKITLVDSAGTATDILLGNETATATGTYAKIGSEIYIFNTYSVSNLTDMFTMKEIVKQKETPTAISGTPLP